LLLRPVDIVGDQRHRKKPDGDDAGDYQQAALGEWTAPRFTEARFEAAKGVGCYRERDNVNTNAGSLAADVFRSD
jgi:hypothetical protein